MAIRLNLVYFRDSHYGNFKSHNDPRIPVIKSMLKEMESLHELEFPRTLLPKTLTGYSQFVPNNIVINVILVDSTEALEAWGVLEDDLGCHVISDWQTGSDLCESHKVVINFSSNIKKYVDCTGMDLSNSRFSSTAKVEEWLMTITHEIAHAVEFIECSNGLTPCEVGAAIDDSGSDFEIKDFSTGNGIMIKAMDYIESLELCEERVENKANDWYFKIRNRIGNELLTMKETVEGRREKSISWPIMVQSQPLFHVGSLTSPPVERYSLEGSCISVSSNPDDWRLIARLSGESHEIKKTSGAQLLDMLFVAQDPRLKKIAVDWAISKGLAEPVNAYRVIVDEDSYIDYYCKKEALEEAGGDSDLIDVLDGVKATATLLKMQRSIAAINSDIATDFCIMAYAEHELGLDGVWWNEELDTFSYSAPRGGFFNPTGKEWSIIKTETMEEVRLVPNKRIQYSTVVNDWVEVNINSTHNINNEIEIKPC